MTDCYGFTCVRDEHIAELTSRVRLFRHTQTGAEVLSLENDEENKVFGITFRTPPRDSTGVSHIVEHAVLCGSRKYPVKEPFVELLKGSLKTFLNAFTYPDKTCYPVASQNVKDFYNLIDVYLDAVLYPRITPAIFQQEGWHYELEQPDAPLVYKGVVFNEMKGAYGSPERVLSEYGRQALFPDVTYGVSSGGHPHHIPDLTYEQFRTFHQTHYHPSNARIFFYGNDDPMERLRLLDAYLKDFQAIEVDSAIGLQSRFEHPDQIGRFYPVDPDSPHDNQNRLTVNWLLRETTDPVVNLSFHILEHILIGTIASPLRRALIESGLGEDLAGDGMVLEMRQAYFSTGLRSIASRDADAVESLIMQTLRQMVQEGIDAQTVEAALNTLEFALRENNTGPYPRGLAVMLRALDTWLYDGDPLALLAWEHPLTEIKGRLEAGERYFEALIEHDLLNNPHRVTLLLQPDPELGQREAEDERIRLEQARAAMSPADIEHVRATTSELKRMQETPDPPEALAAIPRLQVSDLDRQNKGIPLALSEQQETTILSHDLHTNGILYLDIGFNLWGLPRELLPYTRLFGRALREMGTDREDYSEFARRISRKTGGMKSSAISTMTRDRTCTAWLFVRAKSMLHQVDDLLDIVRDMLLTARLDNRERFEDIVLEAKARAEASLVPGGTAVVNTRLRSFFNEADWASEQIEGVSNLFFLRQLAQEVKEDWPGVLEKLERIRTLLVNRRAMLWNVTLDETSWHRVMPRFETLLSALPLAPVSAPPWSPDYGRGFEGLTMPAQVNYVGKAMNLFQAGYTLHGSVDVITGYLRMSWLWDQIRVQGGAYTSACLFDEHSGVLTFLSYRDPNVLASLDVYDRASQFLRQSPPSDAEIANTIIGSIGKMDTYQLPDAKGFTSMIRYLVKETDETRQRRRDEILATTAADFRAFAEVLDHLKDEGIAVVLGSPEAIAKANEARPGLLTPLKVL